MNCNGETGSLFFLNISLKVCLIEQHQKSLIFARTSIKSLGNSEDHRKLFSKTKISPYASKERWFTKTVLRYFLFTDSV